MPPSNCCNAPMTPVVADEGTGYYECSGCKKPCDPAKPFTLDGVLGEFDEKEAEEVFNLMWDDLDAYFSDEQPCRCSKDCTQKVHYPSIISLLKSAFAKVHQRGIVEGAERMIKAVPKKTGCKSRFNDFQSVCYEDNLCEECSGFNAARSALLAKGREMGLGE